MKTLDEIKLEYARSYHYADWGSFLVHAKMNDWKLLDFHLNQIVNKFKNQNYESSI